MAINLYKYTGEMTEPKSWDSDLAAPVWYGGDGTTYYAFLDDEYAALCTADDLAVTTAADDKAWVKTNSRQAKSLRKECRDTIRKTYTLEDELAMARTDDTDGKAAITAIVDSYSVKIAALVGD